uniref:Uncharacterized protein n=1 Tax=Rhizophora mucronata TaxID=61149 RepID=A0A2P2IWM1_RHIMU
MGTSTNFKFHTKKSFHIATQLNLNVDAANLKKTSHTMGTSTNFKYSTAVDYV